MTVTAGGPCVGEGRAVLVSSPTSTVFCPWHEIMDSPVPDRDGCMTHKGHDYQEL